MVDNRSHHHNWHHKKHDLFFFRLKPDTSKQNVIWFILVKCIACVKYIKVCKVVYWFCGSSSVRISVEDMEIWAMLFCIPWMSAIEKCRSALVPLAVEAGHSSRNLPLIRSVIRPTSWLHWIRRDSLHDHTEYKLACFKIVSYFNC